MAFPITPTDQEIYNGYKYYATTGVWKKDVATADDLFPIGMIYTQYPGKSSPTDLGWPGTWENKSSEYAGDFFRAEGGNALAFDPTNSTEQSDENKSHSHSGTVNIPYYGSAGSAYANNTDSASNSLNSIYPISINASGGLEARPVNKTIRIWERVS